MPPKQKLTKLLPYYKKIFYKKENNINMKWFP